MKRLLSFAAFFLSVLAAPYSDSTLTEWDQYKAAYDKLYETTEEDTRRLETYLANKQMVEEHNSRYQRGETMFTMAINKFSDWYPEELDRLTGLKPHMSRTGGRTYERQPDAVAPDSINWVEKGAVTPVKDQGNCGSCYAFSAVGALEALMFRKNKNITSLSVQELIDCSLDAGCDGGLPEFCYYSAKDYGEETDTSYPYEIAKGACRANSSETVMYCNGVNTINAGDEQSMKDAVGLVGPVSMGMAVSTEFIHYHKGVYDGSCGEGVNHAMLAVGYGKDDEAGKDYWLIKNSWGDRWGEKGYVRVIRNVNKCFLSNISTYPI